MEALTAQLLALVVTVVVPVFIAKVFAWLKAQKLIKADSDLMATVEAFECGVQESWETYGKGVKKESGGKKYTPKEKSRLKKICIGVAKSVAAAKGVDVTTILAPKAIDLLIRKIVDRRKRGK